MMILECAIIAARGTPRERCRCRDMRGHAIMRRRSKFGFDAANDNGMGAPRAPSFGARILHFQASSEPFRIAPRSLMIAGFAGLVLLALSSAFLMGLAAVG